MKFTLLIVCGFSVSSHKFIDGGAEQYEEFAFKNLGVRFTQKSDVPDMEGEIDKLAE